MVLNKQGPHPQAYKNWKNESFERIIWQVRKANEISAKLSVI